MLYFKNWSHIPILSTGPVLLLCCRGVRKNWELPESFPNKLVAEAYREPRIDANKNKFTFGRPDLELLRLFCRDRFGWTEDKVDSLLVPVLQAYDQRQSQLRMEQFLQFNQRFAKIRSKRLQQAVAGITGAAVPDEIALAANTAGAEAADKPKERKKRGRATAEGGQQGKPPGKKPPGKAKPRGKRSTTAGPLDATEGQAPATAGEDAPPPLTVRSERAPSKPRSRKRKASAGVEARG